jgi:HD superfamily phosphohydrolase
VADHARTRDQQVLREMVFEIMDPIHGRLSFPDIVRDIVDTELFQRLRRIKQLGLVSLVFPGAVHDRFLHSLGTAALAQRLALSLRARGADVDDSDVLCVTIAALCHDLGHVCYGHTFEVFMRQEGSKAWRHETASVELLRRILAEQLRPGRLSDFGLGGNDARCIEELIDPPKRWLRNASARKRLNETTWAARIRGRPFAKAWLYEIVSNWRSGVDVDKFDYLRRDAYYLGIPERFDHDGYINTVTIGHDESGTSTLAPPITFAKELRAMFDLRKRLHEECYQCMRVKRAEVHMISILSRARQALGASLAEATDGALQRLTDVFVDASLTGPLDEAMIEAIEEYRRRFSLRRQMFFLGETAHLGVTPADILRAYHKLDGAFTGERSGERSGEAEEVEYRQVDECELVGVFVESSRGLGAVDPMSKVIFHTNDPSLPGLRLLPDAPEQVMTRRRLFFWDVPERDEATRERLRRALGDAVAMMAEEAA